MSKGQSPPGVDELEVSIFGPGKGEAIAVHLGGGDWLTVDSCIDQVSRRHPVLDYLRAIGVDVENRLKVVIATHAHNDHVAGIAELYKEAKAAKFVMSSAMASEEFLMAVEADADVERYTTQSVLVEYRAVFAEAERRGRDPKGLKPLRRAMEQQVVWNHPGTHSHVSADVRALSPSHEAVTRASTALARSLAVAGQTRRLAASDPNEFAVSLWIETVHAAILLGGDLTRGPTGCGWHAVLATHDPSQRASLFKIPHHGSPNAHHEGVWTNLVTSDVISAIAPYRAGRNPRPNEEDINRISSLSGSVFVTAPTSVPKPSDSIRKSRRELGAVADNVREPWGRVGHVRARKRLDNPWRVDTARPAKRVS